MELRSYLEKIVASVIYFPVISANHRSVAFYTPLPTGMGITTMDLYTWQSQQFIPSPSPMSITVGLVPDLERHRVIYAADNQGDECYYLYSMDTLTRHTRCLTPELPGRWMPIAISPDGRWLSAISDSTGDINLWRIALDRKGISSMAQPGGIVSGGKWSPDSRWLTASMVQGRRVVSIATSFDDQEVRRLSAVTSSSVDLVASWSPSGDQIAITSEQSGVSRIGIINLIDGSRTWLETLPDEQAVEFSPSGRRLLAASLRPDGGSLAIYDLTNGNRATVGETSGQIDLAAFVDEESIVAIRSENIVPPQIVRYDVKNAISSYVETLSPRLSSDNFVLCQHIVYSSEDNTPIPALLYKPKSAASSHSNPAVVVLHGGPGDHFREGFDPYAQFLVKLGFVVLEINIRGSSGYGRNYQEAIRGA